LITDFNRITNLPAGYPEAAISAYGRVVLKGKFSIVDCGFYSRHNMTSYNKKIEVVD